MKILHVITGLGQGGAENVLYRLVSASVQRHRHHVVSLTDRGVYGPRLESLDVAVDTLAMRPAFAFAGAARLHRVVRQFAPDVLQTWMYHADLLGGLVGRASGLRSIVWGLRNSDLSAEHTAVGTRWVVRLCARISDRIPARIVSCSRRSAAIHQAIGYASDKFRIIANGYDVQRFAPRPNARSELRAQWRVAPDQPLLGNVARWAPQKDHETLLAALALLPAQVKCVLVGTGMSADNEPLRQMIAALKLRERVVLCGARADIPEVMSAIDVHVLSSAYGEAFPNVIAEAMACGAVCVSTDVGDAGEILGDCGWLLPPRRPRELADAIGAALQAAASDAGPALRGRARQRVVERFPLTAMVAQYEALWAELAQAGTA